MTRWIDRQPRFERWAYYAITRFIVPAGMVWAIINFARGPF